MSMHHAALAEYPRAQDNQLSLGAGRRLLEQGKVSPAQLFFSQGKSQIWDATVTEIMRAQGWITEHDALHALSHELSIPVVDLAKAPPDFRLAHILRPEVCLKYAAVPWIEEGGRLVIATSRPENICKLMPHLPANKRLPRIVLAREYQIQELVSRLHRSKLVAACEQRVRLDQSCRGWAQTAHIRYAIIGVIFLFLLLGLSRAADQMVMGLVTLTLFFLLIGISMKTAALSASRFATPVMNARTSRVAHKLPKISVLVPLFHETEIATALLRRLHALTYPRALLDVVLVLEETDKLTQATIAKIKLPDWIRVVTVPTGTGITTKPRAMNYALDFCRGEIIGIWDAEDAPDPVQLETIAAHFAHADDDVACVQGVLDYYNPDTNWISRCFTLEYSMWFRIILRGMSRLGAPIPLGGTTLFMHRDALEKVGRWDAHNVTEDADLGIRLTRFGYRTELSLTVTQEEANCGLRPWIKQRSRWLKGYMVTYLVHMKKPRTLLRELGVGRFLGLNVILLAALMQFLLAPVLWCFWFLAFGLSEPLGLATLPSPLIYTAMTILGCATLMDFALAVLSMRGQKRRRLIPWVFVFLVYFPMATLAAYKALFELITMPFYWDKTAHGQTKEGQTAGFSAIST